jgi:hypothetical protein
MFKPSAGSPKRAISLSSLQEYGLFAKYYLSIGQQQTFMMAAHYQTGERSSSLESTTTGGSERKAKFERAIYGLSAAYIKAL